MRHFLNHEMLAPNVTTVPVDPDVAASFEDMLSAPLALEILRGPSRAGPHSTKPSTFDAPVALLSFTFGTDRMDRWGRLALTAAKQAGLIRRPDGEFMRCEVRQQPASRLLTGA